LSVFAKFPGLKGKAKGKYADWIDFASVQVGPRSPMTAGSARPDHPKVSELAMSRPTDEISYSFYRQMVQGDPMFVVIELVKGSARDLTAYLRMELKGALITSYSSGAGGADGPFDLINLSFESIRLTPIASKTPGAK
jgi:type VI protein secretion system component Hcp